MTINASEISYFERRIRNTLEMATLCKSLCGKDVHLALADLYVLKVKELRATLSSSLPSQADALSRRVHHRKTDRLIANGLPLAMPTTIGSARKVGTLSMKDA